VERDLPVSAEFLRDFTTRWGQAWNSHRTEDVLGLLTDDIEWDDTVFRPEVIHGASGVRTYVEAIWRVMPDVQFEEVQLFTAPDDGRGLFLFRQSGSAPERYGAGRGFATLGCDVFLGFRGGRLSQYLAQYELTEMMRQFGALPPRGDRTGSSYLLSLLGRGASNR
jgi:predicted ester cyclase